MKSIFDALSFFDPLFKHVNPIAFGWIIAAIILAAINERRKQK